MNCPHPFAFDGVCSTCGAKVNCLACGRPRAERGRCDNEACSLYEPPEVGNCPHGHPIGCKPPCGACVRGEPADKAYVGYANLPPLDVETRAERRRAQRLRALDLAKSLTRCDHRRAKVLGGTDVEWCIYCGAVCRVPQPGHVRAYGIPESVMYAHGVLDEQSPLPGTSGPAPEDDSDAKKRN